MTAFGQVPSSSTHETEIQFSPISNIMQVADTYRHLQVTTGFGQVPMPIMCSQGRNRSSVDLALAPAIDIVSRNTMVMNMKRALATRAYLAADIALQPISEVMLTDWADPDHLFFNTIGREMMAIWHEPFYLRLMLASWKHITEASYYERLYNREAKKPRTEH